MENILYIFYLLLFFVSIGVILSKGVIHSLLYLILFILNISIIILSLKLEFFTLIFLIVYLGAIGILFIFIIMMLNLRIFELNILLVKYIPVGIIFLVIILLESYILIDHFYISSSNINCYIKFIIWDNEFKSNAALGHIGIFLYLYYFFFTIIASLLLLIAMLGAIILTAKYKKDYEK